MRLREHPVLIQQSVGNWPPVLFVATGDGRATGEVGVLKWVVPGAGAKRKFFIFVEHDGSGYIGTLKFDSAQLCAAVCGFFDRQIGRSLKEIGDIDLGVDWPPAM
jgi:hypothetical protein